MIVRIRIITIFFYPALTECAQLQVENIYKFFESNWYGILSRLDGCHDKPTSYITLTSSLLHLSNAVVFIVLREFHLVKSSDTEATFSAVYSSDILKQHTIIKCVGHICRLV